MQSPPNSIDQSPPVPLALDEDSKSEAEGAALVEWLDGAVNNNYKQVPSPPFMAGRRGPKNYKQVRALIKSMGGTGGQEHCFKISKLDPQLRGAFLKNVVISGILNNYDGGITQVPPGFMVYLTSSGGAWSDDNIISARAFNNGGNVSLSANRYVQSDEEGSTRSSPPD